MTTSINRYHVAVAAIIMIVTALVLHAMGHVLICSCGIVKLWDGVVNSPESSQHLTDWYTLTHVLHGLIFYLLACWVLPRASLGNRFVAATLVEAGWEILENSPWVIERYRSTTISLNYYGDSIINSMSDILAMMVGFWLARCLPVYVSIALFFVIEIALAYTIRDNLTLNVLMLVWPVEAIRHWQAGG
ncbi:MAG: DUF2585 domain-containing protein [Hyphomicrobiaceae bacterium]